MFVATRSFVGYDCGSLQVHCSARAAQRRCPSIKKKKQSVPFRSDRQTCSYRRNLFIIPTRCLLTALQNLHTKTQTLQSPQTARGTSQTLEQSDQLSQIPWSIRKNPRPASVVTSSSPLRPNFSEYRNWHPEHSSHLGAVGLHWRRFRTLSF